MALYLEHQRSPRLQSCKWRHIWLVVKWKPRPVIHNKSYLSWIFGSLQFLRIQTTDLKLYKLIYHSAWRQSLSMTLHLFFWMETEKKKRKKKLVKALGKVYAWSHCFWVLFLFIFWPYNRSGFKNCQSKSQAAKGIRANSPVTPVQNIKMCGMLDYSVRLLTKGLQWESWGLPFYPTRRTSHISISKT